MSSEAKVRAVALRRQFEEEMRQAELLEQEEKRVEELRIQEEERKRQEEERRLEEEARVLAEQDRRCRELTARREEERRRREVAMTLARDKHLDGAQGGGSWRAENGWVCNPCRRLNKSCIWRQDNKKVHTCYFCQCGKILCAVDPANAEAGPLKKMRVVIYQFPGLNIRIIIMI